jgi:hypothetical protein
MQRIALTFFCEENMLFASRASSFFGSEINQSHAPHNLARIMSRPRKKKKVTNNNIRNSWSRHYTDKVAGWKLFDHKKTQCNNVSLF